MVTPAAIRNASARVDELTREAERARDALEAEVRKLGDPSELRAEVWQQKVAPVEERYRSRVLELVHEATALAEANAPADGDLTTIAAAERLFLSAPDSAARSLDLVRAIGVERTAAQLATAKEPDRFVAAAAIIAAKGFTTAQRRDVDTLAEKVFGDELRTARALADAVRTAPSRVRLAAATTALPGYEARTTDRFAVGLLEQRA